MSQWVFALMPSLRRAADFGILARQIRAEGRHSADDEDRDQRTDKRIFHRRRAGLVADERFEKGAHCRTLARKVEDLR